MVILDNMEKGIKVTNWEQRIVWTFSHQSAKACLFRTIESIDSKENWERWPQNLSFWLFGFLTMALIPLQENLYVSWVWRKETELQVWTKAWIYKTLVKGGGLNLGEPDGVHPSGEGLPLIGCKTHPWTRCLVLCASQLTSWMPVQSKQGSFPIGSHTYIFTESLLGMHFRKATFTRDYRGHWNGLAQSQIRNQRTLGYKWSLN